MVFKFGAEVLLEENLEELRGKRVGLLTNWSAYLNWSGKIVPTFQALLEASREYGFQLVRIFSPQHGLWMLRQANMLEWDGGEELSLKVFSLYGKYRKPPLETLEDLDIMLVDLQDVGARYYTYVWTLKLTMEACDELGLPLWVLDRPNPIGRGVEGPILRREFFSFVGMEEIPVRHGMTIGELALLIRTSNELKLPLRVIKMSNWDPRGWPEDRPWILPSPNMPTLDTALVYPGGCLFEATNVSEGRGTTRPFEIVGAPEVDPFKLRDLLTSWSEKLGLAGFQLYPVRFVPTFDKGRGQELGGVMVIVTDKSSFQPVRLYSLMMRGFKLIWKDFRWLMPPYEYEYSKMPIDILWGSPQLRELIDKNARLESWRELFLKLSEEERGFLNLRKNFLLYSEALEKEGASCV